MGEEAPKSPLFEVYVGLLELLTVAAAAAKYNLQALPKDEMAERVRNVLIPLRSGRWCRLQDATAADSPNLLRRVQSEYVLKLVHAAVPLWLCKELGVPSMIAVITEQPASVVKLLSRCERDALWNNFFKTCVFRRSLLRIVVTERALSLSNSSSKPMGPPLSQEMLAALHRLEVMTVKSITCQLFDRRAMAINVGKSEECPVTCVIPPKIYICESALSPTIQQQQQQCYPVGVALHCGSRYQSHARQPDQQPRPIGVCAEHRAGRSLRV